MLNTTRSLALTFLLALAGCGGSNDSNDNVIDDKSDQGGSEKPIVISTSPANGSSGISPTSIISASFNQELDATSVTAGSVSMDGVDGSVPLNVSVSGKTVTMAPLQALAGDATYTATITGEVRNANGRSMGVNYSWQFRTAGATDENTVPPAVLFTDPVNHAEGVAVDSKVSISFDQPIDPASVTASSMQLVGPAGNVTVDIAVQQNVITLSPRSALAGGASYTAVAGSDIRSVDGVYLGIDYSWQFATATAVAGLCADFYSADFALVAGKHKASPSSSLSKPARGSTYSDPAYKTCVARVSDASGEHGIGWVRNDYSRRQAFNADDSRYLTVGRYGRWFLHDTSTTKTVRELPLGGGSVEPQWHPTDPDILFVFDHSGGYTIRTHNVRTDERRVVADFRKVSGIAGYPGMTSITDIWSGAARVWTRWEGSPSRDGRYWGLMVQTSDHKGLGMISYDMETNTITGVYDYARDGGGVIEPDHISMSPSGRYVVPSWASAKCTSASQLGTRSNPCGLMSFSRDFSTAVGLAVKTSHSDIGVDASGRDVIVAAEYETGYLAMWDLGTGARTNLWHIWENGGGTALHVSAKSFNKPGWALVSTYSGSGDLWHRNKIFAIEMVAAPRILNIAHTYNTYSNYWTEPHAAVNRDFTRIMFNSNWRSGTDDADAYMITLPQHAIPAN